MIAEQIEQWASTRPESVALVARSSGNGHYETTDYQTLARLIHRYAAQLKEVLPPDARIALWMSPDPASVAALLAAEKNGFPLVLLSADMPRAEAEFLLSASGVSALLEPSTESFHFLESDARSARSTLSKLPDGALCQLTSGSTAESRIAVRTSHGISREMETVRDRLGMERSDRVMAASSIAHSYGLVGGTLAALVSGSQAILVRGQDDVPALARALRPTILFGLIASYRSLLAMDQPGEPLAGVRHALSAGAPLPLGLRGAVSDRLGVGIRQDYGTTETGTISIDVSAESADNCVGVPLSHMEVRFGDDRSIPLRHSEVGEIQVRSEAVAEGYLLPDGRIRSALGDDGWFHTRDAGWLDEQGRLYVGQRLRDPISVSGLELRPEAIERTLQRISGVQEAVVFSIDSDHATKVKAIVVAQGQSADRILAEWLQNIPELESHVELEIRDQLPRSAAGKVLQKYLV